MPTSLIVNKVILHPKDWYHLHKSEYLNNQIAAVFLGDDMNITVDMMIAAILASLSEFSGPKKNLFRTGKF